MFIGVAERQEGEEHLITPAKISCYHINAAGDIMEDCPVMLAHPTRRAASAAGINDAGEIVAIHRHGTRADHSNIGGFICNQFAKIMDCHIA